MLTRPRRSCLTVPGSSERMLEKAAGLPADEVIVDLEDAVAAADKEAARETARAAIRRGLGRTTALRVNGRATPWWEDDLRAAAEARPDVVVLPKVESADDVAAAAELLPAGMGLEAQIETARGLVEVERIAAAGHGLEALVLGPADLAASLGIPVLTIGAGVGDYTLARIAVAARAHGLQAVDGPHAVLGDRDGLVASARRALALGYDGKWAIHPEQLEPVNEIFTPSAEEVARAERILACPPGAARYEGELVDEASRRLAAALLARRSSLRRRTSGA
ncbi:MAG TPA: CoA ester lyase [Gaiellaceae bacterium]|nr:CoA ester lyase [Gaiellaceae bacterium]